MPDSKPNIISSTTSDCICKEHTECHNSRYNVLAVSQKEQFETENNKKES